MSWKTLLVPHDFSASADHATAIAQSEARIHGSAIVLLHVIDLPYQLSPDAVIVPPESGAPISVRQFAIQTAEAHLQSIADQLAKHDTTARCVVVVGVPVDEINRAVDDHRIDLIVMGTHGRTGIRHFMAGSVAERVVRSSKVPVLTIRHPD
ncbi:MAG TPA: universal stress protein [Kofleriaceae bacterium]|jgi:nucleotide-binding universal stress UspA family protein|nr:universal stress protein [Kofleriaceae bacterium]